MRRTKVTICITEGKQKTEPKQTEKGITLAYAQHSEGIKPPHMVVESEIRNFRLQPRIRE